MTDFLQPVLQTLMAASATVVTTLVAIYGPRAIAALEQRTNTQFSEQQRSVILGAIDTAAGVLQTKLDQGILKVGDVSPINPSVLEQASQAINSVPAAMAFHGQTISSVARMIVGAVDTTPRPAIPPNLQVVPAVEKATS
jgi:hypothetical protein